MLFTKEETRDLTIAIIILGLIFSFNEWGIKTFDLVIGIKNLIRAIILCAIIILTQLCAEKIYGKKIGTFVFYQLWTIKPFGVLKHFLKTKIYMGIIVPLLLSILSNGLIALPMVGGFSTKEAQIRRAGRRFSRLTEFEAAKIAFIGIITNLIFLILFKLLMLTNLPFFQKGMYIAATITIVNMFPIPPLNGSKIFFGSRSFYILTLVFIIASVAFLYIFSVILSISLAILMALILSILYFYHKEYTQ